MDFEAERFGHQPRARVVREKPVGLLLVGKGNGLGLAAVQQSGVLPLGGALLGGG